MSSALPALALVVVACTQLLHPCAIGDPVLGSTTAAYILESKPIKTDDDDGNAGTRPPSAYRYELEAAVMRGNELVPLPLPLYVTDTYLGGWNQFDLTLHPDLDLSTEIYYAPDPSVSGNYSTACFGERAFVRRRLELMQRSGLTPAIHIMPHRLVYRNASSKAFELMLWEDEGARVDGQFLNSVALFQVGRRCEQPYMHVQSQWNWATIFSCTDLAVCSRLL
jgi:hypothetical protein